jgi:hypoxanthine phosphoribosyltransferase
MLIKIVRIKWKTVVRMCEKIVKMLGTYKPDVLVGISSGGLVQL